MRDRYWEWVSGVMAGLPSWPRVNHDRLWGYLRERLVTWHNPNSQRFWSVLAGVSGGGYDLCSDYDGAVRIQGEHPLDMGAFRALMPWRKGPFVVGTSFLDAEWDSRIKWQRFEPMWHRLRGARVVDVGCGNGYYMMRSLSHSPQMVLGLDPSDLTFAQYALIQHYVANPVMQYLPLGWQHLDAFSDFFDAILFMGVLYHQRSPLDVLNTLRRAGHKGTALFLDTLVIMDDSDTVLFPGDRYAGMRNVYFIPSVSALKHMLHRSGFKRVTVLSVDATTSREQRTTPWSSGPSLGDFLDPVHADKTIEGYPAPRRVALVADPV